MKGKILLHTCCGVCASHCVRVLKEDGWEPTLFFFNPNIYPHEEYLRRKAAVHPSGCALRRIQRPVCGARIALRALKHTCVLRPLHYREAVKTGAVSEGRSYAFYRRTGDNKRSDGRLPHEKQLSPPQAALDSAAPCRGGFGGTAARKAPLQGELSASAD